tara:strand:- start:1840 stop:2970 length:1131 start_codon:yes stop_codon:yes gene_type:complete
MKDFIPVNRPDISGSLEKKYLNECIETGWISSEGPFVTKFEEDFSKNVGRKFGVAVTNGSMALEIAIQSLDIGPGDEVILPTFTIISCAAAIVRAGAKPIVVDCDIETWNIDASKIEGLINKNTKAIMVVHIYGLPSEMDEITKLSKNYNIPIIEDSAEMHGQTYKNKPCGSFGVLSTFSFYPNKHITTGEGGMIVTDDKKIYERCKSLRNLSFNSKKRFVHYELGWNARMTNLQAALGLAQLSRLSEFIKRKREIGAIYQSILSTTDCIQLPKDNTDYAKNIYWVFGIVLKNENGPTAETIIDELKNKNVGTRPFFWPMHKQPIFEEMKIFDNESHPISEKIAKNGLYLPSGIGNTNDEIQYSAETLIDVLKKYD